MNELATYENLTPLEIRAQINLIQEVMKTVMMKDVHYGVIPGCNAPSLYKPGAEKIMATFRLTPEYQIEDLSTDDEVRYLITTILKAPNGLKVGEGIGECSSTEEKYKWRQSVCDEEFENTQEDQRRIAYKRKKDGYYTVKQVRTNLSDLRNTVLKMAKKRSLVDAVITTTAASDIFTQDIEDLPPEYVNDVVVDAGTIHLPEYPENEFKKNFPSWVKLIEMNKKTPKEIILMISSRYQLTELQKEKINNLNIVLEGEAQ